MMADHRKHKERPALGLWLALLSCALVLDACSAPSVSAPAPTEPVPKASSSTAGSAKFPSTLVISILYFEDRTRNPELGWMKKGMADMLVAELAQLPSVLVVQRQRLEEVVKEQALQLSGRVADESTVRVGRLAGATVLVTGSVAETDGRVRIDAQLMGVEQGTVLGTAMAEGKLTEVPSVARSLVAKVVELLPNTGNRRTETVTQTTGDAESGLVPATKANDAGETLSRAGKMFQALEEFERALAADPAHPTARTNYARTIRSLSGSDLLRTSQSDESPEGDRRIVARLVERLTGSGLEVEVQAARSERTSNGSLMLRVPVRIRLSPAAVEAVCESAQAMGGIVIKKPGGVVEVVLSSRPALNRDFSKELAKPRRIYLRLLSKEGRTMGIYSSLRSWMVSNWVSPMEDQRVRIESGRADGSEAVFAGLTQEQIAGAAGFRMTVDSVPRERAMVRVDIAEAAERDRVRRSPPPDAAKPQAIQALQVQMERFWNPPVTERPWAIGYLPGNERTAVVTASLEAGNKEPLEDLRLVHISGDSEFDQAAMGAARTGLQHWLAESTAPLRADVGGGELPRSRALKVRAEFKLLKDIPLLNLIGPLGSD
jgi:TolB-like protein